MRRIGPLVFLLCLGGCPFFPNLSRAPNSVGEAVSDQLSDELDARSVASGNVTVHVINESRADALVRVTMQVGGEQVHLSERTVPAGAAETIIGPDAADIVIVETARLGDPAGPLPTQTLLLNRDFVPNEIIVIRIPPRATLAIERLDQNVCVAAGSPVEMDLLAAGLAANAMVRVFADPDQDPHNGNELDIAVELPANQRLSLSWDTANVASGEYTVYAESGGGANLVRSAPAPGRVRVVALSITDQPAERTVCAGGSATFGVTIAGASAPGYQWRRDGVEIADATGATLTIDPLTAADAGAYDVIVSSECGSLISLPALLTVNGAPSITAQPADQAVCQGEPVKFAVSVDARPAPTFQWRKDGLIIAEAAGPSLTIDPVTVADAGSYDVVVSNACGSVQSLAAVLAVQTDPVITRQPADQTVCAGDPLTLGVAGAAVPAPSFQWRRDGVNLAGATGATLTIAAASSSDAGVYDVVLTNACGIATSSPIIVTVETGPEITEQPTDRAACPGDAVAFRVAASGSPTYQWRKDGLDIAGAVSESLTIDPVTSEHAGQYVVVVRNECGTVMSVPATLSVGSAPSISQQPANQTVCDGTPVTFGVVADGDPEPSFQWRMNGVDIPEANGASLTIAAVSIDDAGLYDVVIRNTCGTEISTAARLTVDTAPTILEHPVNQTLCEGASAIFTVEADGTPPLSFQWRLDGIDIPGAVEPTLLIEAVTVEDAGLYDVLVQNACGSEISAAARLTIDTAPRILQPPMDETVCFGESVTFNVVADASPSPSYQWRKDGEDIPGATDDTLTIDPVTFPDAGVYDVVVSNLCGVVISDPALLTVLKCTLRLGDLNCDGQLDGGDIDPFFLALGDPGLYLKTFPNCDPLNGDINCDGALDGGDIDPFFACLGAGGCTCP